LLVLAHGTCADLSSVKQCVCPELQKEFGCSFNWISCVTQSAMCVVHYVYLVCIISLSSWFLFRLLALRYTRLISLIPALARVPSLSASSCRCGRRVPLICIMGVTLRCHHVGCSNTVYTCNQLALLFIYRDGKVHKEGSRCSL